MCGIFGIVTYEKGEDTLIKLKTWSHELFKLSESRGKEASGIALLQNNRLKVYKEAVRGSKLIRLKTYTDLFRSTDAFPIALIGHSRLATHGIQTKNRNNQPVSNKRGAIVHNGIIVNDKEIWNTLIRKKPRFEVDTEVMLELICQYSQNGVGIEQAISYFYSKIEGSASIAFLLKNIPDLILATNTGSIYFARTKNPKLFAFASEDYILRKFLFRNNFRAKITQLKPRYGLRVNLRKPKDNTFEISHPSTRSDNNKLNLFAVEEIPGKGVVEKGVFTIYSVINDINKLKKHKIDYERIDKLIRCTHCILPSTMPFINFNKDGVCNYCQNHKKIITKGRGELEKIAAKVRSKNGKPDCILAFSGGRDSSFGLHYLKKEMGLNPIAYTYDWGMVTDLARRNQARLVGKLGVEHLIVSADITSKRNNIRKNILAWLNKPDLGLVPLFMAGDKQAEYYVDKVAKQVGVDLVIYCSGCELENDDFKAAHCGVRNAYPKAVLHNMSLGGKIKMASYYTLQFIKNPKYVNNSLFDTAFGFFSIYIKRHRYVYLWDYITWNEDNIVSKLKNEYGWEGDEKGKLTWRIDDGSSAFYNYIYYVVQGFTENDTFRSNQIREGDLTRNKALILVYEENKPRYEALKWYFDVIGLDGNKVLTAIDKMSKYY